ncbi:hypothetical protein D3C72_1172880 [compost metagenome]
MQPVDIDLGRVTRQQRVRTGISTRITEGFQRYLKKNFMSLPARFLHPALQAVAAGGKTKRDLRRQVSDRFLRPRLAETQPADHDRHPCAPCARPGPCILLHRPQTVRANDRQSAECGFFQQLLIGPRRHARILTIGLAAHQHRPVTLARAGGVHRYDIAIRHCLAIDIGAGAPALRLQNGSITGSRYLGQCGFRCLVGKLRLCIRPARRLLQIAGRKRRIDGEAANRKNRKHRQSHNDGKAPVNTGAFFLTT